MDNLNTTILIQGRINQECYDFYCKKYLNIPVIISTWENTTIDFSNKPTNFTILKNKIPVYHGPQNSNLQITSTLYGLDIVQSEFVIKIRGDEYYSNINEIIKLIHSNKNKIYMLPIYFRHPRFWPFHGSDHLVAGTKENLLKMFTFKNWHEADLESTKIVQESTYYNSHMVVEQNLTINYLKQINKDYSKTPLLSIFLNFEILNLNDLMPYRITSNCYGQVFYNNFIPEHHRSISNIYQIFSN
jgi:hypothetical protein